MNDRFERAVHWCIQMLRENQNPDGGWGATLSPQQRGRKSEPDATGQVLEALSGQIETGLQPHVKRAVEYLRSVQCADGSWASSAGAQQVLCTSSAIRGLLSAGVSHRDDAIAAGVNWLRIEQQRSGAWNSSVSQTAWALLALVAAGRANEPAARRAVEYVLESQDDDGGWDEQGFVLHDPISGCWYRNELEGVAWPLLALSRWAVAASSAQSAVAHKLSLRLISSTAEI